MSTQSDYVEKKLKSGHTFLQRWQNASAKVWEFSPSHMHLTIRLEKEGVKGNLHIVCLEPTSYSGKFKWEHGNFEVKYAAPYFELLETESNLKLVCEDINFYENCKPVF